MKNSFENYPLKGHPYVIARFTGTTSCGFVHDRVYKLHTYNRDNFIVIENLYGNGSCPYSSLNTFLQNWEILGTGMM